MADQRQEIQLSYAIGVAEPTSIMVETFGTGKVANELLVGLIREFFDLRPYGLIKMLDLIQPIYRQTAAYGHFDEHTPWEKVDRAELCCRKFKIMITRYEANSTVRLCL